MGLLEGSAAIQKDLNKLQKRAGRHLTKFNSDKGKVLECFASAGWLLTAQETPLQKKALGFQKITD